jgi:hypothetical protein
MQAARCLSPHCLVVVSSRPNMMQAKRTPKPFTSASRNGELGPAVALVEELGAKVKCFCFCSHLYVQSHHAMKAAILIRLHHDQIFLSSRHVPHHLENALCAGALRSHRPSRPAGSPPRRESSPLRPSVALDEWRELSPPRSP